MQRVEILVTKTKNSATEKKETTFDIRQERANFSRVNQNSGERIKFRANEISVFRHDFLPCVAIRALRSILNRRIVGKISDFNAFTAAVELHVSLVSKLIIIIIH